MNLDQKFKESLVLIEDKINRASIELEEVHNVIRKLTAQELIDEDVVRSIAFKKRELLEIEQRLQLLIADYKVYKQHKEVISSKEKILKNALPLLIKLDDKLSFTIAEMKALAMFLKSRWIDD